jgi:hypothetical protein
MNTSIRKTLLGTSIATLGFFALTGQAQAGQLTTGTTFSVSLECLNDSVGLSVGSTGSNHVNDSNTGWQYSIDSQTDGMNGNYGVGSAAGTVNPYDIKGIAVKETATSIIVALNANMPLVGNAESGAQGGQIGWGDLFFNFKGETFDQAQAAGDLFGIRFSQYNASTVSTGLYSGVTAQTLTNVKEGYTVGTYGGINGGSNSYQSQVAHGYGTAGPGTVGYGDLNTNYFTNNGQDNTFNLNSIKLGTFLSAISFLSTGSLTQSLLNTGYNSSLFNGTNTIAFQFDKSALTSNAAAAAASNNPTSSPETVPEPTTIGGMLLGGWLLKMKRNRKTMKSA